MHQCPTLPLPKESGWKLEDDMLQPRLITLDPIPSVLLNFSHAAVKQNLMYFSAVHM